MVNWAIAVGINCYDNLPNLKYAEKDAVSIKTWFEQDEFDQIFLFTDNSEAISANPPIQTKPPTFGRLKRFLNKQFQHSFLLEGDNFWFFFSGHGMQGADGDYLLLCDSDPEDVRSTAISVAYVKQRLRRSGADNIIMFLDACRNEYTGSKEDIGFGGDKPQGVITFYSCSSTEESYEIDELKQGAFTYVLLHALYTGDTQYLNVERLDYYLRQQVPDITYKYKGKVQHPYANVEPIEIRKLPLTGEAKPEDIEDLKYEALGAEQKDPEVARKLLTQANKATKGLDKETVDALIRIEKKSSILSHNQGSLLDVVTEIYLRFFLALFTLFVIIVLGLNSSLFIYAASALMSYWILNWYKE